MFNHSIIVRGADDLAYKRIAPCLSDYMGKVFEIMGEPEKSGSFM